MGQEQLSIVIDRRTHPTHRGMDVVGTELPVEAGQTVQISSVVVCLIWGVRLDERGENTYGAVVIVSKLDDTGHLGKIDVGSRVDLPPTTPIVERMTVRRNTAYQGIFTPGDETGPMTRRK